MAHNLMADFKSFLRYWYSGMDESGGGRYGGFEMSKLFTLLSIISTKIN